MPNTIITITYNGETHTLSEWSKITGIKSNTLYSRLISGYYTIDEILGLKTNFKTTIITDETTGETHSINEWSKITGVPMNTIYYRYNVFHKSGHESVSPINNSIRYIDFNGDTFSENEWCYILGVSNGCIGRRINNGKSVEDAMKPYRNKPYNAIYFVDNGKPYNEKDWNLHVALKRINTDFRQIL